MHADEQPPGAGARATPCRRPSRAAPPAAGVARADPPGEQRRSPAAAATRGRVDEGDRLRPRRAAASKRRLGETTRRRRFTRRRSPAASSASRVTLNQRTAPPRVSITVKTRPPIVTDSPRRGTRPSSWATRPPMVSNSSVGRAMSKKPLTVADRRCRRRRAGRRRPGCRCCSRRPCRRTRPRSRRRSPRARPRSSSGPAVLPNSSMTIARWLRLERKSRSRSFSAFDSGTNTAGRSRVRRFRSGERCSFSRSLASRMPMTLSRCAPRTPGSASGRCG